MKDVLQELPADVLDVVLKRCQLSCLTRLSSVCKQLRHQCNDHLGSSLELRAARAQVS